MKYPYALIADVHGHKWSQFSTVNADGVNSRLAFILDEIARAAEELQTAGGDTIVIAGDLFHQRGSIDPEVFNPVAKLIKSLKAVGIRFIALPGNHDLAGKETTELGNAFQSLEGDGFRIATKPEQVEDLVMIPWCSTQKGLHEAIERWIESDTSASAIADAKARKDLDLIIHAGIDGVLSGMPDHGLTADKLAAYGFRRVFAGHYHHALDFGNGVFSIGALTHQTWSDVDTKAGFWLVWPDRQQRFASHAPEFIDVTPDTDPEEYPMIVAGNYVRVRGFKLSNDEVKLMRDELEGLGARGVNFQVARETVSARSTGRAATALSLEASLANYITTTIEDEDMAFLVQASCNDILSVVTTAS